MDTDKTPCNAQVDAFAAIRPRYETFADHLRDILTQAARELGITAIIQARAKAIPSFAKKILRKKGKYTDPLRQLTDLCGARVITDTLDQTRHFCRYIREHFDIDEANSLDVLDRLAPEAFGYRSIHFIVSLRPGVFEGIPKAFYATTDPAADADHAGRRVPLFKAEIQVRTLLQHAWAVVAHDNIYKSPFPIPSRWSREAARIAALLEDADESFGRLLEAVTAYRSHFGAYMTPQEMREETANLEAVLTRDPDNASLARSIARLAMAMEDFPKAVTLLTPHADSADPELLCDLAEARLGTKEPDACKAGLELLHALRQSHPQNARVLELLAHALETTDAPQALNLAEQAFLATPTEPRILCGFIERKVLRQRRADFLPLLSPSIGQALLLSRERLSLGIALPWTCLDIALLELFRHKPYAGLEAFALAVSLGIPQQELRKLSERLLALIEAAGNDLPGLEWSRRFLELVRLAQDPAKGASLNGRVETWKNYTGGITSPVVIVAGGCDKTVEHTIDTYRDLLNAAFQDFRGTVISGGTRAGISGIVGDLPGAISRDITLLSHLPRNIPREATVHPGYEVRDCDGEGFTPLGPIQAWMDILASGIRPDAVRVLGVNGGAISAVEYKMAAALGAKVGLLRDSGREAHQLLGDPAWAKNTRLLSLPSDAMTLREFLIEPKSDVFAGPALETMAQRVHDNYRAEQAKKSENTDPAMADWKRLDENLKASNRAVAAHDCFKLRAVGLDVRTKGSGSVAPYPLSQEQIEVMAELEHGRWNMERLNAGWRLGPRDHAAKTSPYLVTWEELPEEIKQYDRDSVVKIPERMWEIGYEVYPAEPGGR